jgi:protocatechuate 3,4-dioxygenase beta subunit
MDSFEGCSDPRLRHIMRRLVDHLHAFADDVRLTPEEWKAGVRFLTDAGHITTDERQEFILLSDTLGLSMFVDAINHDQSGPTTESTVLGPFWAEGSPWREYGASLAVRPTAYPIPDDGPVGQMLAATGRHPWRPAHIHLWVEADGYQALVTHIFHRDSQYLDSDTVFAVKPSLIRDFVPHAPDDPERPNGSEENRGNTWYSVENDLVLSSAEKEQP